MAKPITPLDLYYCKAALRRSNVLFISASGKNNDVLSAYKIAASCEPKKIYSICTSLNSPLAKLAAKSSYNKTFEYNVPTGKDGFLATNSLIAFFVILYRAFTKVETKSVKALNNVNSYIPRLDSFINKVDSNFTFIILYAGWGQPVAIDLESKLSEAALANVMLADYRNFGHGRHNWFDKRKSNSAIIALITPEEKRIAEKTLSIIPQDIPVLHLSSEITDASSSIDLLIQSFYFVDKLGKKQGIDPGKPGVPEFGSKLYNLNYTSLYASLPKKSQSQIAIARKANVSCFNRLTDYEAAYWSSHYNAFTKSITNAKFGSIIFDYDGTLCSMGNRLKGIDDSIANSLIKILSHGIVIGIATGRGKSVRDDLNRIIPKSYSDQIIIGYYNGGSIGRLKENDIPIKSPNINSSFVDLHQMINDYEFPLKLAPELKPNQITIKVPDKGDWAKIRPMITQLVMSKNIPNIQILESSHSLDIVDQTITSKLNVVGKCIELAKSTRLPQDYLCIGDKGQWPGNDYHLLSSPYSLSVDEVSSIAGTCWNIAAPGIRGTMATEYYLSCIKLDQNGFCFSL
jgi:hydroxymethylpyrimidine pyrophosphatase-like HAD family hydrolase